MAFADDTLISTTNVHDMKNTIKGLSLEIEKIGISLNPLKCHLMIYDPTEELIQQETKEYAVYIDDGVPKCEAFPENIILKCSYANIERC